MRLAVAALLACLPLLVASMFPTPGPGRAEFAATPPSTITAAISANRTSGVAPFAVRFIATGSDCDGDSTPNEWNDDFEQCLYSWDFDDPSAGTYDTGAFADAGQPWDANIDYGPITGHVFENSGTYVVELTIRNQAGETDTETVTITVSDPSGAVHCFRDAATGDFTGCPGGATTHTQSNVNTALTTCGAGNVCLFRRGDTGFTLGGGSVGDNTIIGAFGSGNRPRISGTGTSQVLTGGDNVSISDIEFVAVALESPGAHRLLHRVTNRDSASVPTGLAWGWEPAIKGFYFVRSELYGFTNDYGAYGHGEEVVMLGSKIYGNGGGNHNYRGGNGATSVWAHNQIGPSATPGNTSWKITGEKHTESGSCTSAPSAVKEYRMHRGNLFIGIDDQVQDLVGVRPQGSSGDDPGCGSLAKQIWESNMFRAENPANTRQVWDSMQALYINARDVVVRNNVIKLDASSASAIVIGGCKDDACNWAAQYRDSGNVTVANNTAMWVRTTGTSGSNPERDVAFPIENGSGHRLFGNLFYHAISWTPAVTSCSSCDVETANSKVSTNPFTEATPNELLDVLLASGSAPIGAGTDRAEAFFDARSGLRSSTYDQGAMERQVGDP